MVLWNGEGLVGLHITAIQTTEDLFEFVVCLCLVRHMIHRWFLARERKRRYKGRES